MCHIVRLEGSLVLLRTSKVLAQHQPVQDVKALALRLETLLHQSCQLEVVLEFLIGTIGVHHMKRVIKRLPYTLIVAHRIQVFSEARVNIPEPHAAKERKEDYQASLDSEYTIFLHKVHHKARES